jgi:hypothetical protein
LDIKKVRMDPIVGVTRRKKKERQKMIDFERRSAFQGGRSKNSHAGPFMEGRAFLKRSRR